MAKNDDKSKQLEQTKKDPAESLSPVDNADLFHEVGRLTRELHEAINGFLLDKKVSDLVEKDMPDAGERLRYVITMTEQSANTTLSLVEKSLPMTDEMGAKAEALSTEWGRFKERELSVDDFRAFSSELSTFLGLVGENSERLHNNLTEVLMAQGFQDITGQIIRQVIDLVRDVEGKLVQLVRISGAHMPEANVDKDKVKLAGPAVPGIEQGDMVQGQDDVDDLLSSLGF